MNPHGEWLETDGLGGFASGTRCGIRTRRYHALLLVAAPHTGRFVLINGLEATIQTPAGAFPIASQQYRDCVFPDSQHRIESFVYDPHPRWIFALEDGTRVEYEIIAGDGSPAVLLSWRLRNARPGVTLKMRLLHSGRGYHELHRENAAFRFDPERAGDLYVWRPYDGVPEVCVRPSANGEYRHAPDWYRNFYYAEEARRGLDAIEDLAAPGEFTFDLSCAPATLLLSCDRNALAPLPRKKGAGLAAAAGSGSAAAAGSAAATRSAASAYLIHRGDRTTIVAGYPWFTDWGRDTFIALRGLCPERAPDILIAWSETVSEGMLPNRFPDGDAPPEYNSVDASLWFVIDAFELLSTAARRPVMSTVEAILDGYTRGTRYGIHMDSDGLLAAGVPGMQLTWMDAKVGDWVVTPRIGKPVEIQALWMKALKLAGREDAFQRALQSFRGKFWDASRGYLLDVADPDDAAFRPNQIFAVPFLEASVARTVVDAVEQRLLTPLGLRTLAPGEPGYAPRYAGGPRERDGAYHQGTVWPWLMGPFVEAWLEVYGDKAEARRRFLDPLLMHLEDYGFGHLPEIADGDAPHTPAGCPFQAWSLGEMLRIKRMLA